MMSLLNKLIEIKDWIKTEPATKFEGSIASFNLLFRPKSVTDMSRMGFKRDSINIPATMYNFYAIRNRYIKQNPLFSKYIDEAKAIGNKVFVSQTVAIKGKEQFIVIAGNNKYDCKKFYNHTFLLSLNKHIWKWGIDNDIFIKLNGNGDAPEIFVNGKVYDNPRFKRFINEYKDLTQAVNTCLDPRFDFTKFKFSPTKYGETQREFERLLYTFSDTHIGDKTITDNFGPIKEEALVKFLETEIIPYDVPVLVGGDLLELWQATFKNIEEAYPKLFDAMKRITNLVIVTGNHDDEMIEKKDVSEWMGTVLPNAKVFPSFAYSFEKFDIIAYHGDIADPLNNNTKVGKLIAYIAGKTIEQFFFYDKKNQRTSAEQRFESYKNWLFSTQSLVERDILNYLTNFVAVINSYLYFHQARLKRGEKLNLMIAIGHTHEMVEHQDSPTMLQNLLYSFVEQLYSLDEFAHLRDQLKINFMNMGAGSGEILDREVIESRSDWEEDLEIMRKFNLTYKAYVTRMGEWKETSRLNGRQNSQSYVKMKDGSVNVCYTNNDYNDIDEVLPLVK